MDLQSLVVHVFTQPGRDMYSYVEERSVIDQRWAHNARPMTVEAQAALRKAIEESKALFRSEVTAAQTKRDQQSKMSARHNALATRL